jgi:hypothetical protein
MSTGDASKVARGAGSVPYGPATDAGRAGAGEAARTPRRHQGRHQDRRAEAGAAATYSGRRRGGVVATSRGLRRGARHRYRRPALHPSGPAP